MLECVLGYTTRHDLQNFINSAAGGKVWRIDTGLSSGIQSGVPEALEITPDGEVSILAADRTTGEPVRIPGHTRTAAKSPFSGFF